MAEPTPIKIDPESVSENTEPQTQEAPSVEGEQIQQNPKRLENAEGINAIEPETIEADSFLNALIENNQNKAPEQETNQAEVDVEALQQLIAEGADPTQLLEETAAGEGEPTDGGGIYIPTIERTAEEVLADAGFATAATETQDIVVEEVLITAPVVIEPPITIEDNDVEISGVDDLVVDEDGLQGAVVDASPLRSGETASTGSEIATGHFTIDAPDGVGSVTIEGAQIINNGVLVSAAPSFTTGLGNTFTVTAYNAANGEVTYKYKLEDNESHNLTDDPGTPQTDTAFEDDSVSETFAVVLTDTDGDTANTSIIVKIVDDIPTLSVTADASAVATLGTMELDETVGTDRYALNETQDSSPSDEAVVNAVNTLSQQQTSVAGGLVSLYSVTANAGSDGEKSAAGTLSFVGVPTSGTPLATNLKATAGGAISLVLNGSVIEGRDANGTGDVVFTIAVVESPASSGVYQLQTTLHEAIDHDGTTTTFDEAIDLLLAADGAVELQYEVTRTDGDADSVTKSDTVDLISRSNNGSVNTSYFSFDDDGPTLTVAAEVSAQERTDLTVNIDETVGTDRSAAGETADGNTDDAGPGLGQVTTAVSGGLVNLFAALGGDYGSDGAGTTTGSFSFVGVPTSGTPLATNLKATAGGAISLVLNGSVIEGRDANGTGDVVFTIAVVESPASSGVYQLQTTLHEAIDHDGTTTTFDEAIDLLLAADGAVELQYEVTRTDGDADSVTKSDTVDLISRSNNGSVNTSYFSFDDDGPSVNTVTDTTIINVAGESETGTFDVTVGTDVDGVASLVGNVVPVDLTSGGLKVHYFVDATTPSVLIAYTGTVGTTTPVLADQVFKLTLQPGSDQYTYDLYQPIDGPITTVSIDGASAFGAGPQPWQELTNSGTGSVALLSGWKVAVGFDPTSWRLGTTVPVSQLTFDDVNGSTNGWGVDNQNFTTGEFMRFDFADADDFDGAGPYVLPTFTGPNVSVVTLDFIGYNNNDVVEYVVHYVDGTSSYAVLNTLGTTSTVVIPSPSNTKPIDYVEVYAESANGSGKVDLESVGTVDVALPDALNFAVSIIDADGDTATDTLTITFDNPIATPPVLLMSVTPVEVALVKGNSGNMYGYDDGYFSASIPVGDLVTTNAQLHDHGGIKWSVKGKGSNPDEAQNDALNDNESIVIKLDSDVGNTFTIGIGQGTDMNKTGHVHIYDSANNAKANDDITAQDLVDFSNINNLNAANNLIAGGLTDAELISVGLTPLTYDETHVTMEMYDATGVKIGEITQDLVFATVGDHTGNQDGDDDSVIPVTVTIGNAHLGSQAAYIRITNSDADIPQAQGTAQTSDRSGIRVLAVNVYILTVEAALIDTDGSETLSNVLITASSIPADYEVIGATNVTIGGVEYYEIAIPSTGGSAEVTLSAPSGIAALTDADINAISGSVTSTETGSGFDTATTTATARVELEDNTSPIEGTASDEVIFATIGDETLTGTAGSDIFTFESTATGGTVTITDFESANDQLDLRDLLVGEAYTVDEQGDSTGNLDDFLTVSFGSGNTTIVADIDGSGGGGTQTIILTNVDLVGGLTSSAEVVDSLLSSQTLIVD